jgi:hypothetical protein
MVYWVDTFSYACVLLAIVGEDGPGPAPLIANFVSKSFGSAEW